jgi:retron-type reverse transcriptase
MAGVTAAAYAEHRDANRRDRPERLRSGRYQAAPGARVWIEQADGRQRPRGNPAVEDPMVPRAVARRLEAIEEQAVWDGAEGFRPGRRPHAARPAGRERGMKEGRGWIGEAEVSGYVASMDRTRRREVLRQRVTDGRRWRRLGQWRRAGVRDHGVLTHPATGVGPGGGIAPVRAHRVLPHGREEGFARAGPPRLTGRSFLTRVADDGVRGGAREADAQKSMGV